MPLSFASGNAHNLNDLRLKRCQQRSHVECVRLHLRSPRVSTRISAKPAFLPQLISVRRAFAKLSA